MGSENLEDDNNLPLPDWQKAIIDERLQDLEQNMDDVTDVFETLKLQQRPSTS